MIVYLMRHGKAEPGEDDAARRLTEKGQRTVASVAKRLKKTGVQVDRVEHSGLVRARETAAIVQQAVGGALLRVDDLLPEDDVRRAAMRLLETTDTVMLVGHLPFMERLAAYLLTGDPEGSPLRFRTASVACLSRDGEAWALQWLLDPDLA